MKIKIEDYRELEHIKGYRLFIGEEIVRDKIPNIEEVVKEIKKYLRLRFKEPIK